MTPGACGRWRTSDCHSDVGAMSRDRRPVECLPAMIVPNAHQKAYALCLLAGSNAAWRPRRGAGDTARQHLARDRVRVDFLLPWPRRCSRRWTLDGDDPAQVRAASNTPLTRPALVTHVGKGGVARSWPCRGSFGLARRRRTPSAGGKHRVHAVSRQLHMDEGLRAGRALRRRDTCRPRVRAMDRRPADSDRPNRHERAPGPRTLVSRATGGCGAAAAGRVIARDVDNPSFHLFSRGRRAAHTPTQTASVDPEASVGR